MEFFSLDVILGAIGVRVTIPDWAKLAADEPVWMQNVNESYYRNSEAAALLDHHLITAQFLPLPRWLDMREGTGYPRPSDAARDDGLKFLLELAKWYRQWRKFDQEFRMRRLNAFGRWADAQSENDYAGDCPQMPDLTRVREIGFDPEDIVAFLDRSGIPHVLKRIESQEATSIPASNHSAGGDFAAVNADLHLLSSDEGTPRISPTMPVSRVIKTVRRGRRSPIDKALRDAYVAAGEQRHDVDEVFGQLVRLAKERPGEFHPLIGYENGQVMFWEEGRKRKYQKKALAAYIGRRQDEERNG